MAKSPARKCWNWVLHVLARRLPGSRIRVALHRWRGVKIGVGVFLGEEVYLENNYPECVEIGDNVQIGIRTIVMAHLRGPGRVIIEKDAYVGPGCVIAAAHGRTIRIGEGAVIGALSAVTSDVAPRVLLKAPGAEAVAAVRQPLSTAGSYQDFMRGLSPMRPKKPMPAPVAQNGKAE